MEAILLLANSAEPSAQPGMVNALGMGWSVTTTPTPATALVVFISVPWDQTNRRHSIDIRLVDADGHDFLDANGQPLFVQGQFEVGRPAGVPAGTTLDQALTINVQAGLNLVAERGYEWRLSIDGESKAQRPFFVH